MKKLPILFAIALFALFFASCSSNGDDSFNNHNGSAAGCFEDTEQIINDETGEPFTGGGKVYMAEKRTSTGELILTEETMLLVGTMNNGIITFNCPKNVNSHFLRRIGNNVPAGVSVEPLDVEGWLYSSSLRLIDDNGTYIGDIEYGKQNGSEIYAIRYAYFSKEVKINGNDSRNFPQEYTSWEIDAKKGWNKILLQVQEDEEQYNYFLTTDLSKAPNGLQWILF